MEVGAAGGEETRMSVGGARGAWGASERAVHSGSWRRVTGMSRITLFPPLAKSCCLAAISHLESRTLSLDTCFLWLKMASQCRRLGMQKWLICTRENVHLLYTLTLPQPVPQSVIQKFQTWWCTDIVHKRVLLGLAGKISLPFTSHGLPSILTHSLS